MLYSFRNQNDSLIRKFLIILAQQEFFNQFLPIDIFDVQPDHFPSLWATRDRCKSLWCFKEMLFNTNSLRILQNGKFHMSLSSCFVEFLSERLLLGRKRIVLLVLREKIGTLLEECFSFIDDLMVNI